MEAWEKFGEFSPRKYFLRIFLESTKSYKSAKKTPLPICKYKQQEDAQPNKNNMFILNSYFTYY